MPQKFPRVFYLLAIAIGLGTGLLIAAALLRATGTSLDQLVYLVRHRISREAPPASGDTTSPSTESAAGRPRESKQISSDDAELGWAPIPNAAVQFTTSEFDITYVIDGAGGRLVPGAQPGRPLVLTLGGSFTFGHGVENAEVWPSVLQEHLPELTVRNRSANAWGTAQCMAALRRDLEGSEPVAAAVYAFPMFHLSRNYRRRNWLEMIDSAAKRRLPLFAVENGRPVFQGLIGPEQGLENDAPGLRAAEWHIFEALVREMAAMTAAHEARFVLVLLPWTAPYKPAARADHEHLLDFLRGEGIEFVDLLRHSRLIEPGFYYIKDRHPNPKWHRLLAETLAESEAFGFARGAGSRQSAR
ncbi:MAG: SGNH/GDSL hydrolase family protein [bacterium]|nr:SGNH/GDSL hydrolase family protein [bacterium]